MNLKHDVAENKYQQYRDRALEQARRNLYQYYLLSDQICPCSKAHMLNVSNI